MNDPAADVLRDTVLAMGVPPEVVDRAEADGTLELLALEHAVADERPEFDLVEVAARTGIEESLLRAFWRALGFPEPRAGERVFTRTDVDMLGDVVRFIDAGALDSELALQMSRVIGSSLNRIAVALVDAAESGVATRTAQGMTTTEAELVGVRGTEVLPLMPRVMELVWRRHLGAAARRRIIRATADEGPDVCVGFADLVGFTAQTQELPEHQLAEVVGRFESIAFDLVSAHGGRLVKMIGDEAMFMCDDVCTGAELALDMAATYRQDEHLSDVRVGLAAGPVLERDGDIFGSVVNLASRITGIAYPGTVVVSPQVHDTLQGDERFVFRSLRSHYLKEIGRVPLWTLRRVGDESEEPYRRERRRRAARERIFLERGARVSSHEIGGAIAPALQEATPAFTEEATTEQLQAISDAVLEADLDTELQVELLADIEASRRLHELEIEAQRRVEAADLEAEQRVAAIEQEAREKVEEAEAEARRRIEQVLNEAEEKSRKANEEANRKVAQAEETAERKAEAAKRDARKKAKRKAERGKRAERSKRAERGKEAERGKDAERSKDAERGKEADEGSSRD